LAAIATAATELAASSTAVILFAVTVNVPTASDVS